MLLQEERNVTIDIHVANGDKYYATYQNNSISHNNEEKEPVEPDQMNIFQVNPFLTNLPILYPPKTSGNQK